MKDYRSLDTLRPSTECFSSIEHVGSIMQVQGESCGGGFQVQRAIGKTKIVEL